MVLGQHSDLCGTGNRLRTGGREAGTEEDESAEISRRPKFMRKALDLAGANIYTNKKTNGSPEGRSQRKRCLNDKMEKGFHQRGRQEPAYMRAPQ